MFVHLKVIIYIIESGYASFTETEMNDFIDPEDMDLVTIDKWTRQSHKISVPELSIAGACEKSWLLCCRSVDDPVFADYKYERSWYFGEDRRDAMLP